MHRDRITRNRIAAWLAALACVLLSALTAQAAQAAESRLALVIGNSRYDKIPLTNPANDAAAMAKALQRAGFQVDLQLDADQRQMDAAIRAFGDRLRPESVGLFYFAGHGVQVKGRNFLLPVGSRIEREDEVPFKSVDAQQVLDKMSAAKNRLNIVVLDACRDNPFAGASRSTAGGGLSQMDAPSGSLLAFATAPGSVASDGKGANGLYTQHLLTNIERPGLPVEQVFKRTRLGVRLDSRGQQVPWENTSLEGDFFFHPPVPGQAGAKSAALLPPPPSVEHILRAEQAYELLRQRKLDEAERLFKALSDTGSHPEVALMGREGLAEILLARGNAQGALTEANAIIASSPARSAAYLIRGRALSASGQVAEGTAALKQAAAPQTEADFAWQKSQALVAVGNLQRANDPQAAVQSYEQAVRADRQSVPALSNLAVALNQTGQAGRAQAVLQRAQALDPQDAMTAALLRQVRDSLAAEQDGARQKAIDDTVRELAQRLKDPAHRERSRSADDWTSPIMAISVLPFQDRTLGSLSGRIGFDSLLQEALIGELQARGFTLVERRLLDKLIAEINLGSSALADPDAQVRLGRILSARLMVSGVLNSQGAQLSAALRAIDTETTQLAMVRTETAPDPADPAQLAAAMAQQVAATVAEKYPLKGRVAAIDGERVIINLGKRHGVRTGQGFNVLVRGEPIELNGRVLGHKDTRIARLTVTEVDEGLAYASVADAVAALEKNQRIVARSP